MSDSAVTTPKTEGEMISENVNKTQNGEETTTLTNQREREEEMNTIRRVSNSELKRKRIAYYAARRSVDSLETKRTAAIKVIKSGRKERVRIDKETDKQIIVVVKLTDAETRDEKLKLAQLDLDLEVAKDELKKKDFGFSIATKIRTDKVKSKKQEYKEKKDDEKNRDVQSLINSAALNSGLTDVLELRHLAGNGANINDVKLNMMKIVRKENKFGYPIKNISHKTVEIIMAGLLSWNPETEEQPFDFS